MFKNMTGQTQTIIYDNEKILQSVRQVIDNVRGKTIKR